MINPEAIAELIGHPLESEIPAWDDLPSDPVLRITFLRQRFGIKLAGAAAELAELRHRGKAKFTRAGSMFFDREGLEQSSGESVAIWRGAQFADAVKSVADLTCCIGGDTIGLASQDRLEVQASDLSAARVKFTNANVRVYGHPITAVCRAAEDYPAAESYFLDPSRRATGKRTRHLAGISPGVDLIMKLAAGAKAVGIKLSPATPDIELAELGGSVDFISDKGICKEAFIRLGALDTGKRRAIVLPGEFILEEEQEIEQPGPSRHGSHIFEPDPAVVRAGLIPEVCKLTGARVIDPLIAYLTADEKIETPFGKCYQILASLPFSEKAIRGALRGLGIGRVILKKRGTSVDLESIRKKLQSSLAGEGVVIMTRIGVKPWAFICAVSEG